MFADSHTHLYLAEFDADRDAMIARAVKAGVEKFYLPNIDSTSVEALHKLCEQYPDRCFPMMGLHPCSVKENYKEELQTVYNWLQTRKYCAVGEIGLDLYWDKSFFKQQVEAFETQIKWALEFNLPIVIHCRDAFDEILSVLSKQAVLPRGIFHCFSGTYEQAQQVLALKNFKLGIGGVVTFKNSGLDKTVEKLDLKDIVLETDAPYLTPTPYRGQRNESAYISIIARRIAEIKNCNVGQVAEITTKNSTEIFGRTA